MTRSNFLQRIKLFVLLHLFLLLYFSGCVQEIDKSDNNNDFNVIGYLMTGNASYISEQKARQLTDIIYFAVEPSSKGTVDSSRIIQKELDYLNDLKDKHGFRLLLAVGGWGQSEHFALMAQDADSRRRFILELHQFCLLNNFDGIDYDWEFPENNEEKLSYERLIIETAEHLKPDNLLLTVALSPWQKFSNETYEALDRIHIMAYDQGPRHSTYEVAVESIKSFVDQGVEYSKLCLGVPFYGRKINDRHKSITYRQLQANYDLVADDDEVDGYYFNGQETIKGKTRYCLDYGIGGIMIWELAQDTDGETSLLTAIIQVINDVESCSDI